MWRGDAGDAQNKQKWGWGADGYNYSCDLPKPSRNV